MYYLFFCSKKFFLCALSLGALFTCYDVAMPPVVYATTCVNTIQSGNTVPNGYGAAYNPLTTAKELLVQSTSCPSDTTATVKVGNGQATQYNYKNGYYWDGSHWQSYTLSGTTLLGDKWYAGEGVATIPVVAGATRYFVGYSCSWNGTAWKCGCRDSACTQGYWQIQGVTVTSSGGGGGTSGSGLPADLIPFVQPSLSTLKNSNKLVVAHWHQFPISRDKGGAVNDLYDSYLHNPSNNGMSLRIRPLGRPARTESDWKLADALIDIKWAQDIGVDAFFFNGTIDQQNQWAWPMYITYLKAAKQLNSGFYAAPNIDCTAPGSSGSTMANNIINRLKDNGEFNNPNQLKINDKFVVGSFNASSCSVSYWTDLKNTFAAAGLSPHLMCVFLGGAYRSDYDGVCDSWSDWGRKDPASAAGSNYSTRYAGAGNEPIVAAISHGDTRYKNNENIAYEQKGSETLRVNWEEAINTGADWAQLVTWNDLGEHAVFYPNTGEQFAMYDLSAYYIAWFKTGQKPTINKDALYYFHRIAIVPPAPTLRSGSWSNLIEVVAFLTAPATVEIITNSGTTQQDLAAGMQVVTAPMPGSGRPRFRIVRNGTAVVDIMSAFTIGPAPTGGDIIYRAGGSLRTLYGQSHSPTSICTSSSADVCLQAQGEPVWLAQ